MTITCGGIRFMIYDDHLGEFRHRVEFLHISDVLLEVFVFDLTGRSVRIGAV
jgi:hypothetical protein